MDYKCFGQMDYKWFGHLKPWQQQLFKAGKFAPEHICILSFMFQEICIFYILWARPASDIPLCKRLLWLWQPSAELFCLSDPHSIAQPEQCNTVYYLHLTSFQRPNTRGPEHNSMLHISRFKQCAAMLHCDQYLVHIQSRTANQSISSIDAVPTSSRAAKFLPTGKGPLKLESIWRPTETEQPNRRSGR